ncbi:putative F-box protein [Cocos nucifera]|uniref:Putative F-box protein n=1 Tax=Cocos nucifera TaxID=13894 RepID=A0A8K0N668_COCNU|nr:putative F-box protein [Cocos nucifera]
MFNLYGRHIEANNTKKSGRDALISHARWLQQNYQELKVGRRHLCFSNNSEYIKDVMEWIRMATARDVEELDTDFSIPDNDRRYPECFKSYAELPPYVYMLRNSLHALRLSGCKFRPALFGKFGALRKLSIERVEFDPESLQLKKVNIMNFRGHKNEVCFLKYLLNKSSRLEELSITIASDMSDGEDLGSCISAAQQLQRCEKASPNVQILIR